MKSFVFLVSAALAAPAFAQTKPAAPAPPATQPPPAMDLTKVGPPSRKPKDEKAVKKDIDAFLKAQEELWKKGDLNATLAGIAFPIFMVTDDSQGNVIAKEYSKDEYVAVMKPFFENMPKERSATQKYTVTVLSDALADVVCDYTMTVGKQKVTGRSDSLVIKQAGKWMWKTMVEAGWGDMAKPPSGQPPAQATPGK